MQTRLLTLRGRCCSEIKECVDALDEAMVFIRKKGIPVSANLRGAHAKTATVFTYKEAPF
jgi:hypothetical protein